MKALLSQERPFSDLDNDDFYYSVQQKGVDARIGVDITTLTFNHYADTIVLMASDADFVPASQAGQKPMVLMWCLIPCGKKWMLTCKSISTENSPLMWSNSWKIFLAMSLNPGLTGRLRNGLVELH